MNLTLNDFMEPEVLTLEGHVTLRFKKANRSHKRRVRFENDFTTENMIDKSGNKYAYKLILTRI